MKKTLFILGSLLIILIFIYIHLNSHPSSQKNSETKSSSKNKTDPYHNVFKNKNIENSSSVSKPLQKKKANNQPQKTKSENVFKGQANQESAQSVNEQTIESFTEAFFNYDVKYPFDYLQKIKPFSTTTFYDSQKSHPKHELMNVTQDLVSNVVVKPDKGLKNYWIVSFDLQHKFKDKKPETLTYVYLYDMLKQKVFDITLIEDGSSENK